MIEFSHYLTGLGVTDEAGKLVDEISARDLRGTGFEIGLDLKTLTLTGMGFDAESFWRLYSSIKLYKAALREKFPDSPLPTTLGMNSTLLDCMYKKPLNLLA